METDGISMISTSVASVVKKHWCTMKKLDEGEACAADLLHTQRDYCSLWQSIQGLPLSYTHLALELILCCSLVQIQLLLVLTDEQCSATSHYLHRITQSLSVYFTVEEDESNIYSAMNIGQLKGFFGHTFAHINTTVALIEYMSSSTHDIASRRLAAAHKFLFDEEHNTCKDWFECFLRTKSILLRKYERDTHNYFNGWWSGHIVPVSHSTTWASPIIHLWNGNILAWKGKMHLALCKYRQCLLTAGSMCTGPALLNSVLVFQKLNDPLAEIEARTLLLKACHDLETHKSQFTMIWRRDHHISKDSGLCTQFRKAVYVAALRALSCKRPKLAVSLLEVVGDLLPLPGVVGGVAPSLLMIYSLLRVGRSTEALDYCFKVVCGWKNIGSLHGTLAGIQLVQALLLGSIAAFELKRYDVSNLLAGRCTGLSMMLYPKTDTRLTKQCSKMMQMSLVVLAILLVGTGRLTCSLSLLRTFCVVADSTSDVMDYNVALLKLKLSPTPHSVVEDPLSPQQLNNCCLMRT